MAKTFAKELYQGKKALVIGLGISGRSAVQFLLSCGAHVQGVDQNQKHLDENPTLKEMRSKGLVTANSSEKIAVDSFDFVVVSPGVPQMEPLYKEALEKGIEVMGEIELACRSLDQPFLAITGTNGKTTVTLLVAHVLNFHGKAALALGNVGKPLAAELLEDIQGKIIVAELSSYQLETLHRRIVDVGVILNITPDHLDRYPTMENYAKVKLSLSCSIKTGGKLYVEEKTLNEYRYLLNDQPYQSYGYTPSCDLSTDKQDVYLKGNKQFQLPPAYQGAISHEVENLLAAYALCHAMGINGEMFLKALETFKKPAHRIEFVRKHEGVAYYDDSKGTNIDAVMRAVSSLPGKIILIAGGVDKGSSYTPWIKAFAGQVKGICAIGQAAEKMKKELAGSLKIDCYNSLETAVQKAVELAEEGDSILLSPGCSSFDMFRDYAHRGEEFQRIVHELKGKKR